MKTNVNKIQLVSNSHFKRSHTHVSIPPVVDIVYKRECRKKNLSPVTGRMTVTVEYETVDRYADMKDYRVSDFSLENLLAINASLPFVQMSMSPLAQVEQIENVLSNIQNSSTNS